MFRNCFDLSYEHLFKFVQLRLNNEYVYIYISFPACRLITETTPILFANPIRIFKKK